MFVSTVSSIKATYNYTPGLTNLILIITPLLILLSLLLSWTSPTILAWYGHVLFANWQYRISYLVIINFFALLVAYSTSIYFSSNDVYDYYLVIFNFFFWIMYLFYANNLFTFIFFIEVISTLIILLLTTSTFSSSYFYNLRNLSQHSYFQTTTPKTFFNNGTDSMGYYLDKAGDGRFISTGDDFEYLPYRNTRNKKTCVSYTNNKCSNILK